MQVSRFFVYAFVQRRKIPLMKSLYGTIIGGIIPIYEMHPENAIRLYLDKNLDSGKLASHQFSLMFEQPFHFYAIHFPAPRTSPSRIPAYASP